MILRPYQTEAVNATFQWMEANQGNPLISLPTGSGKSIVIAEIVRRLAPFEPRILVITHVKELIVQNHSKLPKDIDAGIYSAGVGSRQHRNMVTFCGIQSVYKKAGLFGHVDLVMIDEAHLLSPNNDAMYQRFLSGLMEINPAMRIIGLTATPFRTAGVLIGEGNLFDDISYELPMQRLIKEGYLAPLKSRSSETQADMAGVKITAGEYNLAQMADRHERVTKEAVAEIAQLGANYKSWLIFASSVKHCDHVAEAFAAQGVQCGIVTGETQDRDSILAAFKSGQLRAIVNFGVLTTGFDAPRTDLIALLRSTQSTGLYVQILGRGMRTAPDKTHCLVLDYGGNIERHGPVDAIRIKEKRTGNGKKEYEISVQPTIICPACRSDCHARTLSCSHCGHEFPIEVKHEAKASEAAVLSADVPIVKTEISETTYHLNKGKNGKPDSMRVHYYSSFNDKIVEWVCFDHGGRAGMKARTWWKAHCEFDDIMPDSTENALANVHLLKPVEAIEHRKEGDFERIYRYYFKDPNDPKPIGDQPSDTEYFGEEIVF